MVGYSEVMRPFWANRSHTHHSSANLRSVAEEHFAGAFVSLSSQKKHFSMSTWKKANLRFLHLGWPIKNYGHRLCLCILRLRIDDEVLAISRHIVRPLLRGGDQLTRRR